MATHLDARRVRAGRWIARCPAHADRAPSLTVAEGRDGRVLLHCFAGCSLAAILQNAGLTMQQLFAAAPPPSPAQLAKAQAVRARQRAEEAALRRRERMRTERIRLQLRELYQLAGNWRVRWPCCPTRRPVRKHWRLVTTRRLPSCASSNACSPAIQERENDV